MFTIHGAFMGHRTPVRPVICESLPVFRVDVEALKRTLQGVFEPLALTTLGAMAFLKFTVEQSLWYPVVRHSYDMASPSDLALHQHGVDAGCGCSSKYFGVGHFVLPMYIEQFA